MNRSVSWGVSSAAFAAAALFSLACASAALQGSPPPSNSGSGLGADGAQEPDFVYVANQDDATISVIDVATWEVVETLDLQRMGFGPTAKPHHIVVEPDGAHWYLSLIGENRVLKFDRDNRIVGSAEFQVPGMLALDVSAGVLFVGRSMSAVNPPTRIGRIEIGEMDVEEIEVLFPRPHAIAVRPSGDFVYSASLAENRLASVDAANDAVETTALGGPTQTLVQFAISPDGATMVATAQLTSRALIFDLADPRRPRLLAEVEVGAQPWHPVFSRDGRYAYFGNKEANTVTILDVPGRRVARVLSGEGIDHPHGSTLSPDGRYVLISNNGPGGMAMAGDSGTAVQNRHPSGTVVVIDSETQELVSVVAVGKNATGIGARRSP